MKKKIVNDAVIKKYCKKTLFSQQSVITTRINQINNFDYQQNPSLTFTEIFEDGDFYIYRQEFVKQQRSAFDISKAAQLAEALDYLGKINFVHGDINRKNIVSTKTAYKIVDYEPDLFQMRRGKPCQLVTQPYVSELDRANNRITSNTDKIGFCYFLLRSTERITSSMVYSLYHSKIREHSIYIGLCEDELAEMSYREILNGVICRPTCIFK